LRAPAGARALAGLAIVLIAGLAATDAHAILGGIEVAADDAGGRATVIVSSKTGACTGLVYGERYIITAAHCLMNRDFSGTAAPQDVTITYGRSLGQPDVPVRRASALVPHEHFLAQQKAGNDRLTSMEDIGLIRIDGTHPSAALGAELPPILNDYVVCCVPRARSWPLVWMDVYGFGAAPKGETLHKLRVSAVAPDAVWKGVDPKGSYVPRQLGTERLEAAATPRGICHGDSGGPAFLVAPRTWTHAPPGEPIRLVRGHPLAVGLVTWGDRDLAGGAAEGCSDPFHLVRLDYYADWILSHVRETP
jgi:secreted trypsin-like serine protease